MPNRIYEFRTRARLSMQALAEAAGTTAAQINKLEKGERRLTVDWMVRLARPLGVAPADLLPPEPLGGPLPGGELAWTDSPAILPIPAHSRPIPVRNAARGGFDQAMFLEDGALDYATCPPYLLGAPDAYALYMVGTSMVPMYRPGQLLFVDPRRSPRPGSGVVIYKVNGAVLLKEWVKTGPAALMVREYQPILRDFTIPYADIRITHAIAGATEP